MPLKPLEALIAAQAEIVHLDGTDLNRLWITLLETEDALIPDGLHIIGQKLPEHKIEALLD